MPGVVEALREATRGLHIAVEQTGVMARLMCPPLAPDAYLDYLCALQASVAPLARSLLDAPPECREFVSDAWGHLPSDLRESGRPAIAVGGVACLSKCPAAPWGRLYVVRGAESGMVIVARQLQGTPWADRVPRRFLDAVCAGRQEWPRFRKALERVRPATVPATIATAVADFEFALRALRTYGGSVRTEAS
jgi:heme oxygenase